MLHDEQILTFSEAAKVLPAVNGKRPHCSTLWRWARRGVQGVRLETRRIGGRFVTSAEALERFTKTLAEIPLGARPSTSTPPPTTHKRTPAQRAKDISKAERELAAAGI